MPNWVRHNVVIRGNKEDIARCYEHITKGGENFSFRNIIPRAEELEVTAGSISHLGEEWGKLTTDKEREEFCEKHKITRDEDKALLQVYADNIKKYGFPTWYEWSIENWGTKWDVDADFECHGGTIELHFDTAWSTPIKVFIALSKQYPTINIYAAFADEDLGWNCGEYEIKGGMVTSEKEGDFDFACEVWGYSKEDLEDMGIEVD